MYAIVTFLVVGLLALLFSRAATGALIATGMPPEIAAFQARSAFTGAGFTTTEAENVVNHPVRRRVVSTTMFVGNLGVPTLVVTVVVGFVAPSSAETQTKTITFVVGLAVLVFLAFTPPVTRFFVRLGQRAAQPMLRRSLREPAETLLALNSGYRVAVLNLHEGIPLRSIRGLENVMPGVTVLGVIPHDDPKSFVTGPPVDVDLEADDQIIVLAKSDVIDDLVGSRGSVGTAGQGQGQDREQEQGRNRERERERERDQG